MSELQTVKTGLPVNIQEIANEVLIGRDRLDAIRAALRSAKKLNKPTYEAMKAEGREYGERILDYELKLSEYFRSLPKASGRPSKIFDTAVENKTPKMQTIDGLGFEQKEAERIQQLTPEAVEKAKAVARENNDIPTRSLAIQIAKQDKKETEKDLPKKQDQPRTWNFVYHSRLSYADEDPNVAEVFEMANEFKDDDSRVEFFKACIKAFKRAITEMGY